MQTKQKNLSDYFANSTTGRVVDGGMLGMAFLQYILSCKEKPVGVSFE